MAIEIERRFLVPKLSLVPLSASPFHEIQQGYLHKKGVTTRVRITKDPQSVDPQSVAWLTLKGDPPEGKIGKLEFEYQIPVKDARKLMAMCEDRIIHKRRYRIPCTGIGNKQIAWEVDVFKRALKGLVIVEIEVPCETYWFPKPVWVGLEVTKDKRYTNKRMAINQSYPRD